MKRALIIIAIGWLLVILAFVGYKEYTLQTGQEIVLQSAPIDPTDLFRGDYIILAYQIGSIDLSAFQSTSGVAQVVEGVSAGDTVYVILEERNGIAEAIGASSTKPTAPLFIRGAVTRISGYQAQIDYGINSYFVPDNTGFALEREQNMTIRVVVDGDGRSVIKGINIDGVAVVLKDLKPE